MLQIQKMPRKQAIRRRMHSGIADSSKNCAGDFKRHPSTGWKDQRAYPQIELDGYSMSDMPAIANQIPHRCETMLSATSRIIFYYLAIRHANSTTVAPSAAAITDVTIPPPRARRTAM
jgi:hypothetical protein